MFSFSKKSFEKMEGINPELEQLARTAISLTSVDFGISEGLRTIERQKKLVEQKRSQTLKSKHIDGKAIDVFAVIDGEICWEIGVYDDIADAFALASRSLGTPLRWGAAWTVRDIGAWEGSMEDAMNSYIDTRRGEGRRPLIDGPHFELM